MLKTESPLYDGPYHKSMITFPLVNMDVGSNPTSNFIFSWLGVTKFILRLSPIFVSLDTVILYLISEKNMVH